MPARSPGVLRALFSPSMVLLHVAGILAVLAAAWLGQWQLGAWQEHRQDRTAELASAEPVPLQRLMGADDPFPANGLGRPVEMGGRWLPDATVFVSGRVNEGAPGFWMVTPLSTCGATDATPSGCPNPSAIPVVIGWTPQVAAAPTAPRGTASVSGWLQPGDPSPDTADPHPRDDVLPALQIGELAQRVGQDLYSGYVILDTPAEARRGLTAVTPGSLPKPSTFTALRNLLYGVEWWIFGLFAVFLWWRWSRDELKRLANLEDPEDPGDEGPPPDPQPDVRSELQPDARSNSSGAEARNEDVTTPPLRSRS